MRSISIQASVNAKHFTFCMKETSMCSMVFFAMHWILICATLHSAATKVPIIGDSLSHNYNIADIEKDPVNIALRPNENFHFQIKCASFAKLYAVDATTGSTVKWLEVSNNGSIVSGYVDISITGTRTVCFRRKSFVCKCLRINIMEIPRNRRKRDIADIQFAVDCGTSNAVTEGVLLLNEDYFSLSESNKSELVTIVSDYVNVERRNILIVENRGSFYRTGLENPKFISFGLGDAVGTKTNTTVIKFLASCNALSSTDSRISNFKADSPNGKLSKRLGYPLISWYFITGTIIPLATTSLPRTTTTSDPETPKVKGPISIVVSNTTFILEYAIPSDTFYDREDGGTSNLSLYLYRSNGQELPKSSWIMLLSTGTVLLYSANSLYEAQPKEGYMYRLSAIDSSGREAHTDFNVKFKGPMLVPNYVRTIVVTASSSVIVTSYYDVYILDLLHYKMSSYLKIARADFFNVNFNTTRLGYTMLSLTYSFSSRDLVQDSCNASAINDLRSRLEGAASEERFRTALKPQFDLKSIAGERFESSCSGLSSGRPVVGVSIGALEIVVGRFFSFNISSSTFASPTGYKMSLSLELRFENNTKIPSDFWIGLSSYELNAKPALQGIITARMALVYSSMSLKVVAITPLLAENSQTVQLNIQTRSTKASFYVAMTQSFQLSVSMTTFVNTFLSFMSSFLGVSYSSFSLFDYSVSSNVVVKWTVLFPSSKTCEMSQIQRITGKMLDAKGNITSQLRNGLATNVNFYPSSLEVKLAGSCDVPTVTVKIPELVVPKYDFLHYKVPFNAFSDHTDSNLHIKLLLPDGSPLPETSWIWYNAISRTISGFPFDIASRTYRYILRATDVDGHSVDQNISVLLNWTQPSYNFFYQLRFSYRSSLLPYSNVITAFIQAIKIYFIQMDANNVIIFRPLFLANNKLSLYFQNTSLSSSKCDVAGNKYIISKIQDSTDHTKPSQEFVQFMLPNFTIEQVVAGESPSCSIANRKPPYFNSGNDSIAKFFSATKVIAYCHVTTFQIPANSFLDEEEGNTRNLKLILKSKDDTTLPVSNWVALNVSSQTIVAVPTNDVFYFPSSSIKQYKLIATDSDGKSSNTLLTFDIIGAPPVGYYNITMKFNVSVIQTKPYVFEIQSLFASLEGVFADHLSIHIRSFSIQRILEHRYMATLIWSPCHVTVGVCDIDTIKRIRAKLFASGTDDINPGLIFAFGDRFTLTRVKESRNGPCSEDPPYIQSVIPSLYVTFCGPFSYDIPNGTFMDKQDGNTKNLKLKLLMHDGSVIPEKFWLQFDPTKQQVTAVLAKEQNKTGYPKDHTFILIATDKSNLSTNMTITVNIRGIMPRYSHVFTMATVHALPAFSHVLYLFAKRIADYLGGSLEIVSITEAAGQNLLVSWTNCSLRYEPCDVLGIKYMRERMQSSDGTVNSHFKKAMEPEFTQIFLKEVKYGPCKEDLPPVSAVPFGPITVTTCGTYIAKIPEGTFTDREQGSVRNLDLKLKDHAYYWIQFNAEQQEIKLLLTTEIAKEIAKDSVTITLTATDLYLHVAEQEITVYIDRSRLSPNHKVLMQFMIMSMEGHENFVNTYDEMRKRILAFFPGNSVLASIEYDSLPSQIQLNTLLTAEWSSCSLAQDTCERSKINSIGSQIASNDMPKSGFKQALSPNFDTISANITLYGLCRDELSNPIVQNQLPIIDIKFCGYKIYQIPANTFYDKIDGNTRNLTLTVLNGSDQDAAESWFEFDSKQQSLRILLMENSFTNVVIPSTLSYRIKATTKRGLSVYGKLQFRIASPQPNVSFTLKMNFVWHQVNSPSKLEILMTFMNRVSAYLGRTSEDILILSMTSSTLSIGEYFVVNISNCSARYEPCDREALEIYSQKVLDITGVKEGFKQAMGNEVRNLYVEISTFGPCNILNTAPTVSKLLPRLQVSLCSEFNYTIPSSTFFDKEQSKLHLSVTEIDGIPVSGSYKWVEIDSASGVLYGFVSDTVLINKPPKGYNLTIRATDNGKLFTETHLVLDISGPMPQKLYQFTMTLRPITPTTSLFTNEISIIKLLNGYFKAKFTHLISAMIHSGNIIVQCSICILPKRCDESLAYSYFSRLVTSGNSVPKELVSYFAHKYNIVTTSVSRSPLCQAAINPPVPSRFTWKVNASYCGGFRTLVPAEMFSDNEDGNTRNLELSLYINQSHPVPYSYWVQLNKTSQEIYGFPTRELSLSPQNDLLLFAKDSTGQEANVTVKFVFITYPEPKFIYRLVYQKPSVASAVNEIEMFSTRLREFLKDKRSTSFGLIRNSYLSDNAYYVDYANCSVAYDPCDIHALTSVKDLLLTKDQLPTHEFKNAMNPFIINYGRIQAFAPCLGTLTHPPTVRSQITVLNIPVWSVFNYKIPADTFYDTEDGNTRNLALHLTDGRGQAISTNSWLQLNSATQTITAFGFASLAQVQPSSGYSFVLTATDSSKLSAIDGFHAKIYGPVQLLKDCQIQVGFSALPGNKTNAEIMTAIIETLAKFFSLKNENIGLVELIHHNDTHFTFSWSYVSNTYLTMTPSSSFDYNQVDHKDFITKVLVKLFLPDRKTVQPNFYTAFADAYVTSVRTVFSDIYKNMPPIAIAANGLRVSVPFGGYRREAIQSGWFYDYEDGNTHGLKLHLLDEKNVTVGIESWANIDIQSNTLLFSLRDAQRYSNQTHFVFYLKAVDSGSSFAILPIFVMKVSSSSLITPIRITFEFTLASLDTHEAFVNQSIFIINRIAQLYSLGSGENVITNRYTAQYGPSSSRTITWQPETYQDCDSSEVLKKTKEAIQTNAGLFNQFKLLFMPRFILQRVYYSSSCEDSGVAPFPSVAPLEFNVTMCSPFTYKLSLETFVDSIDGGISSMNIKLLREDKRVLSANSWILLNPASLQLYAVYESSMMPSKAPTMLSYGRSQSYSFNLEATNSRGLKSFKNVKISVLDYPYTSDCYTTIRVQRSFGPSGLPKLDVLYRLITSISQYYSDETIKLKVYKFTQMTPFSYQLTFSNCSFLFGTMKRSLEGLDESYRAAIASIFSRMVQENGKVQVAFKNSLQASGFELQNVTVSYSCIESPPSPKVVQRTRYSFFTIPFSDALPYDIFSDTRDGFDLKLSLRYLNGTEVSPDEWLQINQLTRTIFASVTIVQSYVATYRYLLVATDSSYRTANISYIVRIANSPPAQDVKFYVGFSSTFTRFSATAYVLRNFTWKITNYIGNNKYGRNIVIYSYRSFNSITFAYSQLNCNPASVTAVITKLQRTAFKPNPSGAFMAALGPEFTVNSIYVDGPKCLGSISVQITVEKEINLNSSFCGYFDYRIPDNLFRSSTGESTKDLLLSLKSTTGNSMPSDSVVQFSQNSQTIRVLAVYARITQCLNYRLHAKSTRSTSASAFTAVRVNFPKYKDVDTVKGNVCTLTINVTTRYNPSVSETEILKEFIDKLASYLDALNHQIQIISYTRYWTFPVRLTIQFSHCAWANNGQSSELLPSNFTRLNATLGRLFDLSDISMRSPKREFIDSLKPDFTIESIERNEATCKEPPNRPPTAKVLDLLRAPRCGEFSYKLPADLFNDEDGNTRRLETQLFQNDGSELPIDSWIVYDNKTQTISGIPTDEALSKQPREGYQYRVLATDKQGLSTYTIVRIKINGASYSSSNGMNIKLSYKSAIERKFKTEIILAFTRKLSSYRFINDPQNRFRIRSATVSSSSVTVSLLNCTPCSPEAAIKYYRVSRMQTELQEHMSPEFPVSYSVEASGGCNPSDEGYNSITSGSVQNVTFCRRTRIDFLMLNGIAELPPDTKFILRQTNMEMISQKSWFWLNETSSSLEAFPSENAWELEDSSTQYLWSTAKVSTNTRLGSFVNNRLRIVGTPPKSGLAYTISFTSTFPSNQIDSFYISLIYNALASYIGREDIQHISFSRQTGSNFAWRFLVCSLPSNCTDPNVISLNDKFYSSSKKIRREFKAIIPNGIEIKSINNSCSNRPPHILKPNLNLTVPVCGLYRYQIPRDFAIDAEDGDARNLSFSLRMSDGAHLPRNSWIQLNETSHEIYAFPLKSISNLSSESGWDFSLVVKDSGGAQSQTRLSVFVEQDRGNFYSLNFTFQTVKQDQATAFLDIQVKFLSKISSFFFNSLLSQYRVLSFEKATTSELSAEIFNLQFGNCSVEKYMCKRNDAELLHFQQRVIVNSLNKASMFSRYIGSDFRIIRVTNESDYSIDTAPVALNNFSTIRVSMCSKFFKKIPKSMFYDAETFENEELSKTLTFDNTSSVPNDYWVQLYKEHVYVVPHGDIGSGEYKFRLVATDICGQSASTPVDIVLLDEPQAPGIEIHMSMNLQYIERKPDVVYVSQLQDNIKRGMEGLTNRINIKYFERKNDVIKVKWLNCNETCEGNSYNMLKERIYQSIIFKESFLPSFIITNITDSGLSTCLRDLVSLRNITVKVGVCQKMNFLIPKETLIKNGSVLQLLDESKSPANRQDWLQYSKENQSIYGYPRNFNQNNKQKLYTYYLLATDADGNNELTNLTVEIVGDYTNVTQMLTISGETEMNIDSPFVAQEITLINKIGSYFGNYEINSIMYTRSGINITFTWSFCNIDSEICDCNRIRSVREKIRNVNEFRNHMQPEVYVKGNVDEEMLGVCRKEESPRLSEVQTDIIVQPGQYFSIEMSDKKFYDYEDGFTRNLTFFLANTDNMRLDRSWWIKIQDYKICGLKTLYHSLQMTSQKTTYKTIAQDRCGNEVVDLYNVTVRQRIPKMSYMVTVSLNDSFGENCTKTSNFIQKISSYLDMPQIKIYVYNYTIYNGSYNASVVTWGLTNITEHNCTNGTMQALTDKFVFSNGSTNEMFIKFMAPDYQVFNVTDDDSNLCLLAAITLPLKDDDFPWWLIILLLILAILLLIFWCIWLLIPRCCWSCCIKRMSCCKTCCVPGGKFASLEEPLIEEGILPISKEDEMAAVASKEAQNPDLQTYGGGYDPEEVDEGKVDVSFLPNIAEVNLEPLSIATYPTQDEMDDKNPEALNKDTSSGFSDDLSFEEEMLMEQDRVVLAESAPVNLSSIAPSLPRTSMPPLYHFASRDPFSLDQLQAPDGQASVKSQSIEDMESLQFEFEQQSESTEEVKKASSNSESQAFRMLPQPNIPFSNMRRQSQPSFTTIEDNEAPEYIESRTTGGRMYREANFEKEANDLMMYESRFDHERNQRPSLPIRQDEIIPHRKYGSIRQYSISEREANRNQEAISDEQSPRRRSRILIANRAPENGDQFAFQRYSLPRRSLSEGDLLSDNESDQYSQNRRLSHISLANDAINKRKLSRKISKSFFVVDQDGTRRQIVSLADSYQNGPSRRASTNGNTNEELFLVMDQQDPEANADFNNISLAPVLVDVEQEGRDSITNGRSTMDRRLIEGDMDGRYHSSRRASTNGPSRRISTSGSSRRVYTNGPSRRASTDGTSRRVSTNGNSTEEFFLVMDQQGARGNGDLGNISLAPVLADFELEDRDAIMNGRNTVDGGRIKGEMGGRYSMQTYDSKMFQTGRQKRSVGSGNRRLSYMTDMYDESDSGISDYDIALKPTPSQGYLEDETPYRRRSGQVIVESRRRRSSKAKPLIRSSNEQKTSHFELEPRRISRVYVNNGYISDSIV